MLEVVSKVYITQIITFILRIVKRIINSDWIVRAINFMQLNTFKIMSFSLKFWKKSPKPKKKGLKFFGKLLGGGSVIILLLGLVLGCIGIYMAFKYTFGKKKSLKGVIVGWLFTLLPDIIPFPDTVIASIPTVWYIISMLMGNRKVRGFVKKKAPKKMQGAVDYIGNEAEKNLAQHKKKALGDMGINKDSWFYSDEDDEG